MGVSIGCQKTLCSHNCFFKIVWWEPPGGHWNPLGIPRCYVTYGITLLEFSTGLPGAKKLWLNGTPTTPYGKIIPPSSLAIF